MAKKKNSGKKDKALKKAIDEKRLPQNILLMGERVEESKNIYILQQTYKSIHKFTQNKLTNESGGMLIGYVVEEFGKTNIVINGFIEAKCCEATPTTLKFTHDTWEYVHKEMEKKYPDEKIVGWIHTHPNFGIFLSEYDKFIQENFFSEDYQIAYVVDPIQKIEGFYFWINGKLEKCAGFYVYDRTGVKIKISNVNEASGEGNGGNEKKLSVSNIMTWVLLILSLFLIFSNVSQNEEIERLKKNQEKIADIIKNDINNSFISIDAYLSSINKRLEDAEAKLEEYESENRKASENLGDKQVYESGVNGKSQQGIAETGTGEAQTDITETDNSQDSNEKGDSNV